MREQEESVTALAVALHREAESWKPANERLCYDPYAAMFAKKSDTLAGRGLWWMPKKVALWLFERLVPGFHTLLGIRVNHFDLHLQTLLEQGLEQLVILGAGYDTRAYRFEQLKAQQVRVFEVDHPVTQRLKKDKLTKIFGTLPAHVAYVPIDFSLQTLDQLFYYGYHESLKTLFIWEGVTYYLNPEAIDQTLTFVANNSATGSSIIFDYCPPAVIDGTIGLREAKMAVAYTKRVGEPFNFGLDPATIQSFMAQRGFGQVKNVTSEEMKQTYLTGPNQSKYLTSMFLFVSAVVMPRE